MSTTLPSHRRGVLALTALILVCVGFGFIAAASGAGEAFTDSAVADEPSYTTQSSVAPEDVHISTELESASGTVELLVRFEELDSAELTSSVTPEVAMQEHAESQQAELAAYADSTSGVELHRQFWLTSAALVTVDTERVSLDELAAIDGVTALHENFEVEGAEPERFEPSSTPADNTTYGLEQVNATDVWEEFDTRGEGAKIAVLDTGVDIEHPDIDLFTENPNDNTYPGGWAEFDGSGGIVEGSEPFDTGFHGTHVSGTVAGGNESGEAIGVAPGANLMHGLVLPGGQGSIAQIIGGMEWAVDEDADVISMSLGAPGAVPELIDPVRNAEDAGTAVITSSGNSGPNTSSSPGNTYDSFAVGASDETGDIAGFSSGQTIDTDDVWGTDAPDDWPDEYIIPDVSAPGVAVLSSIPEGSVDDHPDAIYGFLDGTSMAAPHVSGTVALMQSAAGGQLTSEQIDQALESTAWKPDGAPEGQDDRYGFGIIDALAATETVAVDSGIEGVVENVDGERLDGATVSFDGFPVSTDSDGSYEVNLAPGEYEAEADAFGHQSSTETVTVEEEAFATQNFTLERSVEAVLVEGQPFGVQAGESFDVVVSVENLESYEVSLAGDYDGDDLTLLLDGEEIELDEPVTFEEPASGEVTLTVETAPDTDGDITLSHTFSGFGVEETVETGPTGVFDETLDIGVVDQPSSTLGDSLAIQLQNTAPWFDVERLDSDELETPVENDEFDVYVIQQFGDADVDWFVEETETPETGVVYLDQFGGESDGISGYVGVNENPNAVVNETGSIQQPTVGYEVHDEHPFFEGVAEPGDLVELYTSPAVLVEAGYHATMQGFDRGDYGNVVTADTAITGSFGDRATGTGLAEDQFTNTVWAPSLGQSSFAAVGDSFNDEAYEILTNAIEFANDEPVIEPTSPQDERIDPGAETQVTVETPDLVSVEIDLADDSTLSADDLTVSVNDDEIEFGEERTLDDESLTIDADVEDVTGSFSLAYTVVTEPAGEPVETEFVTGPTAVYDSPLEVPEELDSIQDALTLAVDGETIIVDDGTYEEAAPEEAPIRFGPMLWVENDGITLEAADGAEPTVLYGGNESIVQNGVHVTGDDVRIEGFSLNLEDGEAVEGGMRTVGTDVFEGTPTTGLELVDLEVGGGRGILIRDGTTDVTIDGMTAIDASGLAGSTTVMVGDSIEDSPAFDPELHEFDHLADVDFQTLYEYGLDFNDADLHSVDVESLEPSDFELETLLDHELETPTDIETGTVDPTILPDPDPTLVTEDIHITNSVMQEPDSQNAHGLVLRDVQNATVEDTDVANEQLRRAVFFQTSRDQRSGEIHPMSENIEIRNVTAAARTSSDSVIRLRSASATIEDTTVESGTIGLRQDESIEAPLAEAQPEIELHNSDISVEEEGVYIKDHTTFESQLNDIEAEVGVQFEGTIDPDDVTVIFNDLSETDVPVALDGETTGLDPIDARLNYIGDRAATPVGDVQLSPTLPEAPDEAPDFDDIDSPTITLSMEADGIYPVGIPGPTNMTVGDAFDSDAEGVVYGFEADSQEWTLPTADDPLEELQALMVRPAEDTTMKLRFTTTSQTPTTGQTDLVEGWNFVTPPFYGDVEETFGYATSEFSLVTHTADRPTGQLATPGDLDGTWTGGDARVSPFEGYFVFSEDDGILPAHLSSNPDLPQLYEQLQVSTEREPDPELQLHGLEPNQLTVEQGETFDLVAIATNTGDEPMTQTLELRADDELLASQPVAVAGEEFKFVEFEDVSTEILDAGEYSYGVFGDDDAVTGTLTVDAPATPADFTVSDLSPEEATIDQNDPLTVSATVENIGELEDTQTVELRADGDELDSTSVSLGGSESDTVIFEDVSTEALEPGTYTHGIFSEDDGATGELTVEDPGETAAFAVSELSPAEATIEQGDLLTVSATVENEGAVSGEQTVELRVDEDELETESVSLDAGESQTVTFENVSTAELEPGTYTHGVFSDDDEATGELTVDAPPQPATFEVSDLDPETATIQTGDSLTVSATVENVGDESGDQSIELRVNGDELDSTTVSLDADENETVTFENVSTAELEPDEYTHGIFSDDDEATGELTVLTDQDVVLSVEPDPEGFESTHTWDVTNVDLEGETLDGLIVDYSGTGAVLEVLAQDSEVEVTNPDGDSVTVNLGADDADSDEVLDFGLGFGEDGEVPDGPATFVADGTTNPESAGEYDANITFVGDAGGEQTFETTFEITEVEPPEFVVDSLDAPSEAQEDEPFDVESVIENVGDVEETQTVEYRIVEEGEEIGDADATFSEEVTLDLGESASVDFTDVVPADEELAPGSYEHGVFTENDSATAALDITEFDAFSVSELDFEAPPETVANQPFDVSTTVTNFADEERTETVELRFGEDADDLETIASEELTLESGESTTVAFEEVNLTADAEDVSEGDYVHGIFAEESSHTADIEVFPASAVDLEVEPDDAGETATHNWEIETADFGGESVDSILLDYSDTGTSFDAVDNADVTVELTSTGDDEPTSVDLGAASEYEGETADITFSIFADSSSTGEALLEVENVENPAFGGEYTASAVFIGNDGTTLTYTETVELAGDEPATFDVSDLEPEEATVTEGDELDVSATVTNTGGVSDEETVEFQIDGDELANETVSLDADENETVTFENVSTEELEPGEYTHGVFTSDDEQTGTLTVEEFVEPVTLDVSPDPEGFESTHTWDVTNVDLEGETLDGLVVDYSGTGTVLDVSVQDAEVEVTNPDGESVTVNLGSDGADSDEVLDFGLGFGEDGEVPDGPATFVADGTTNPESAGEYEANITFVGDAGGEQTFETTFEITEVEPPEFVVDSLDAPSEAQEDEPFDVESVIENVGDLEDTQSVEYRIVEEGEEIGDADATFSEEVTLDLGESTSVDFTDIVPADEELAPGSYEHGVFTENDSATAALDITEFNAFSVSELDFEAPADVVANQPFDVSTTVTNFADEERTETVELRFGEDADDLETIASEELTLESGESTTVAFEDINLTADAENVSEGDYVHGIFAEDSSHTADVEVYPASAVDFVVEPDDAGESSTHSWEFERVDLGTETVDAVIVDYSGTGTSVDAVENEDVTLELTEDGDDEPTPVDPGGGSEYDGEVAEITFSIFDQPTSTGEALLDIESVENPSESGSYDVSVTFVTDEGTELTYTQSFDIE